jgi:mannose-6-phosphate isomerase-like protein (cupin superfamily)
VKIFRWRDGGREIEHFGSRAFMHYRLARTNGEGAISAIELGPGGVIGRHPAAADQLFVVVEGSGEVSGAGGEFHPIASGEAVAWDPGEEHETRSGSGLLAIVVEGEAVEAAT